MRALGRSQLRPTTDGYTREDTNLTVRREKSLSTPVSATLPHLTLRTLGEGNRYRRRKNPT